MRLQPFEINKIKAITRQVFSEDSKVILFGSRVNDKAKGGDIDLFIQTPGTPHCQLPTENSEQDFKTLGLASFFDTNEDNNVDWEEITTKQINSFTKGNSL